MNSQRQDDWKQRRVNRMRRGNVNYALWVMENFSIAANHSGCFPEEDAERKRPFAFFFLSVTLVAIPTNTFSLYVSWQHIRQGNELGVYLFNLALTDLTFTVGLSLWTDFLWRGAWVHGGSVCGLTVYLLYTNFYTSDAFLCCIAADRYLAVAHPLRFPTLRTIGATSVTSAGIWIAVLSLNAVTIAWESSYYELHGVPLCFDEFMLTHGQTSVNVVRFVVGFVVPVALVASCSWGICTAVRSNRATEERERRRVARLLAVVLVSMGICFGPVHVMLLVRGFLEPCETPGWLHYLFKVSIAVSSLNCLVDPLLYCFITRAGKANMTQVVHFIQGKKRVNGQAVV